jgi:hypothetical protein
LSGISRLGVYSRILRGPAVLLLTLATILLGLLPDNAGLVFVTARATANSFPSRSFSTSDCLLADFDRDGQLDRATLVATGGERSIRLTLGNGPERQLSFYSPLPFPGFIQALDLNGDENLDLAWAPVESAAPLVAWLGDGKGDFARLNARALPLGLPQALYVPFERGTSTNSGEAAGQAVLASTLGRKRLAPAAARQFRAPRAPRNATLVLTRVADHRARWQALILNLPPPIPFC